MGFTKKGETRARVRELTRQGRSAREISLRLGITTQAVYKHLERLKTERKRKRAAS